MTLAHNGRLAVAAVRATNPPFDAVLMDMQIPELDGYAATTQLREHFPDAARLPIIGRTASVLPEDRSLALAAGMNDTLAKPFDPGLLYARLTHFTGRHPTRPAPTGAAPVAPFASASAPPLPPDWHLLEELAGGNDAFLRQIVQTFLQEAPALELLLSAAATADPAQGPVWTWKCRSFRALSCLTPSSSRPSRCSSPAARSTPWRPLRTPSSITW